MGAGIKKLPNPCQYAAMKLAMPKAAPTSEPVDVVPAFAQAEKLPS